MSEALEIALITWVVGGFVASVPTAMYFGDDFPNEQIVAIGICTFLFFPLVALGTVGYGVFKGAPFLGRGFAGLYRTVFPAKVKLPKAQVLP